MAAPALRGRFRLPVDELSGLAIRPGAGGRTELVAVGDEGTGIVVAELPEDGGEPRSELHRLPAALGGRAPDLEAIACDGAGTVLVLQEERDRVLVLAPRLDDVRATIRLRIPEDHPDLGEAWHGRGACNARGEGLALLAGGHLLVAKQRDPALLVELGPAGAAPRGLGPDALAGGAEPFPLDGAAQVDLAPLAWWRLEGDPEVAGVNDGPSATTAPSTS